MSIPTDLVTWLKVLGTFATAIGSILLAWRVKAIMRWIVYCLVAHEHSISQLRKIVSGQQQDRPIVEGVTTHLLDIESKLGVFLLVSGLLLLGIGMVLQATSYFVGAA